MTEPLIVVEGNLRLPTLRALTDPSLNFGFEWSPARTRPVQSQSEFALFAARFVTAYVPALSLSDTRSPYRATSLWGVFAKEEIPRAMLRLMQGSHAPGADESRADPIHLAVAAPADAPKQHRFSKPVMAAIAAACGVLIVWLLFDHEPASHGDTRPALAEETSVITQPAEPASAVAVLTATVTPTPDQPAKVEQVSETPTPSASAAPPNADAPAIEAAAPTAEAAPAPATPAKPRTRLIAAAQDRKHDGRVKAVLAPRTKTAAYRAHAADARVVKLEATRRARTTSVDKNRIASRPSNNAVPMNPATLYSMLQHSPTLDSNAASSGGAAKGAR